MACCPCSGRCRKSPDGMSIQVGAHYLEKEPGAAASCSAACPASRRREITIPGGGIAGVNAAQMAVGMRADVTIYDISNARLADMLDMFFGSQIKTAYATRSAIANAVAKSELVIGVVLDFGAAAPKLVTRDMLKTMKRGSVLVDISIDQGGCFEDVTADHPRQSGLRDRRRHPLLRRQHARRGRPHLGLRAQQRDPALRAQARQPGRRGGDGRRPASGQWPTSRAARSATAPSPKRSTCRLKRRPDFPSRSGAIALAASAAAAPARPRAPASATPAAAGGPAAVPRSSADTRRSAALRR